MSSYKTTSKIDCADCGEQKVKALGILWSVALPDNKIERENIDRVFDWRVKNMPPHLPAGLIVGRGNGLLYAKHSHMEIAG